MIVIKLEKGEICLLSFGICDCKLIFIIIGILYVLVILCKIIMNVFVIIFFIFKLFINVKCCRYLILIRG